MGTIAAKAMPAMMMVTSNSMSVRPLTASAVLLMSSHCPCLRIARVCLLVCIGGGQRKRERGVAQPLPHRVVPDGSPTPAANLPTRLPRVRRDEQTAILPPLCG